MTRPSRKRAEARCGASFLAEADVTDVDELLAEAQERSRSERARELIREARHIEQGAAEQAQADDKTVVWHCEACDTRYRDCDDARECCGGDADDPEAAAGIVYDHLSETHGVILGP